MRTPSQAEPVLALLAFEHPLQAVESVAVRMAHGLECLGVASRVFVLPRDLGSLLALEASMVRGVLSLGPLPLSLVPGERTLWERWPTTPFSIYMLDAVIYDLARVPTMRRFVQAAQGETRLALLSPEDGYRQWLGEAFGVNWQHLPFAAFTQLEPGEPVTPQDRWCVVGTIGHELGGPELGESLPDLLLRLLPAATGHTVPRTLADDLAATLVAANAPAMPAKAVCDFLGWPPAATLQPSRLGLLLAVDSWIKRHRRLAAVRSLRGHPLDFFGSGWLALLGEIEGFRYIGQIAHGDVARLIRHYRGVVNFDPNWASGMHDRVYTASAMGVAVLTNDNSALDSAGLPDELVVRYDANRPDLSAAIRGSVHARGAPQPARPRRDILARHSWATRMAEWVISTS